MTSSSVSIWETPFTYAQYPSVGLVIDPDGYRTALLIVAPGGLDKYPKYIVRFKNVLAVTCGEEAGFVLELGQEHGPFEAVAIVWDASPHSMAYANTVFGADLEMRHYVVFGGDNIASIVCGSTPNIETITEPTELVARYAI